jgi:hypothetical protein
MAALDFGMALARGMLPTSEKAQKDLANLAGGRNIFKSEDWWNTQVDKQISEGYRTVERQDKEFLMPSGEYQPGKRQVSTSYGRTIMGQFSPVTGQFGMPYQPSYHPIFGYGGGIQARTSVSYKAPEGAVFTIDPRTREKQYTSRDFDVFGSNREDYTAGELSDIESAAKRGASRVKSESEATKASQRRLRRGTGGLVGKAIAVGDKPATGLPELGTTGLGMTAGLFGADIKL